MLKHDCNEDIPSTYCLPVDNSYHPDHLLMFYTPGNTRYHCTIWTHEDRDIPDIVTLWAAPDGLGVERGTLRAW